VDLFAVSKLLGHTDVKTTQIYAKMMDERKTEAVDALAGFYERKEEGQRPSLQSEQHNNE
jgi:site-specific recombinase XerC